MIFLFDCKQEADRLAEAFRSEQPTGMDILANMPVSWTGYIQPSAPVFVSYKQQTAVENDLYFVPSSEGGESP